MNHEAATSFTVKRGVHGESQIGPWRMPFLKHFFKFFNRRKGIDRRVHVKGWS